MGRKLLSSQLVPPGNLTYFDSYLVLGVISLLIILILRNLLEPKSKKAETTPRIM
jgi:competence protein ComGC